MSDTSLNFDDLEPIEIPFNLLGQRYLLKEASEDAACRYRNKLMESSTMVDGKTTSIKGMADAEPLLVAFCMFHVTIDNNGIRNLKQLTLEEVRAFPSRVVKKLFAKIQEISDLKEAKTEAEADKAEETVGNVPSIMPVGSS